MAFIFSKNQQLVFNLLCCFLILDFFYSDLYYFTIFVCLFDTQWMLALFLLHLGHEGDKTLIKHDYTLTSWRILEVIWRLAFPKNLKIILHSKIINNFIFQLPNAVSGPKTIREDMLKFITEFSHWAWSPIFFFK